MIIGAAVVLYAYRGAVQRQQRLLEERADLILDVVQSIVGAHLRNNRYHPERLVEILEGIAGAPGVLSVRVQTQDGQNIVDATAPDDAGAQPDTAAAFTWMRVVSLQERPFPMGRRGGPRGPQEHGGWMMMPPGPHRISVLLDLSEYQAGIAAARRYAVIGWLLIVLAGLLGLQGMLARRRHAALQTELAIAAERAAHLEKLSRMGAGLTHETKNPLSVIRGMAQHMEENAAMPEEIRTSARHIVDECDRVVGRIDAFLRLSRPKSPKPEAIRLNLFLDKIVGILRHEAADRGVRLELDAPECSIHADPELLRQAVFNLIINALHACQKNDRVLVTATRSGDTVCIVVRDTGCGIDAKDLPHVTEPYFSRFPGGAGLGLALVEDAARASGWRLRITSEPGRGTEVSLDGLRAIG